MYTRYATFYVFHTYRPSFAVLFLILAGAAVARFTTWTAVLIVLGYFALDVLDSILKRKAIEKLFAEETEGWRHEKEDSEYEYRGNLSRIKLKGPDQVIVTRISEMLRRIPR